MTIVGNGPQEAQTAAAPDAVKDITSKFASGLSLEEASEFSRLVNDLGVETFQTSGVLESLESSLTNAEGTGAFQAYKALAQNGEKWAEPFMVNLFPSVAANVGSNDAAKEAGAALISKLFATADTDMSAIAKMINDLGADNASALGLVQVIEAALNSDSKAAALSNFGILCQGADAWVIDMVVPLFSVVSGSFGAEGIQEAAEAASRGYLQKLVELGRAEDVVNIVKTIGVTGIKFSGLVDAMAAAAEAGPAGFLATFNALLGEQARWLEPLLIGSLPSLVSLFGHKEAEIADAVAPAGKALFAFVNPQVAKPLLEVLFAGLEKTQNFKNKAGCALLIADYAELYPAEVGLHMFDIVRELSVTVQDTKRQVKDASTEAFNRVGATISNVDIQALIPVLLKAYAKPVTETVKALDKLLSTTFVNTVCQGTLGIIVPFLLRSFAERKTVMKRRSAVVVDRSLHHSISLYASNFYYVPFCADICSPLSYFCNDDIASERHLNLTITAIFFRIS